MARCHCVENKNLEELVVMLEEIQSRLLDVGSHIATPKLSSDIDRVRVVAFDQSHVDQLEKWIDQMDQKLPQLQNFILPGGGQAASTLHVARSVARRTERSVIPLVQQEDADATILQYLNRLSDFLFMAARTASLACGEGDAVYQKARD
eukprot:CAMPEP_0167741050 /NCGR_PEP_ID=MMETSP0110_2-20121227/639_1 /TAXON_ID=629695 /ORGANISM="Gymnochlora sp., Strain CCMP2014" /LENGTH=148 /DNA_ID=CAMNT_0007625055 /DNA_START=370 /DNA_END=816 /DNA_ORIENTATION=-